MLVKLTARMELRENDLNARDLRLGMNICGNASSVVLNGGTAVLIDAHVDPVGIAVRRLVDGIVHDLPQDVMKPPCPRRADIHSGAQTHRVKSLENGNIARIIMIFFMPFRHSYLKKLQRLFL